ncbi:hypothetical protein NQ318_001312 [Aromia moschata]|uniref:Uncharacterized protein n=1 Tax=Aromia moschata TaxID=1265417 RepID=A0AAV8ZHP3_9CUCU|nr:hypothetical protein NQ318_001312 [Aromia moschata]
MSGNGAAAPEGVNPENNHIGGGPLLNTNRIRNNNNQNPLFNNPVDMLATREGHLAPGWHPEGRNCETLRRIIISSRAMRKRRN